MARLDPEHVGRPHAAHVIVTWRCNLKCRTCGSWKVMEHDDLSAAEWRGVFRQLRSLDLVKVLGGEPFVRPDLSLVLSAVREEIDPWVLQLTTNGMYGKRTVETLRSVGWPGLQVRISVDGTRETHDRSRGHDGSWDIVVRTLREVSELRPKVGFRLGINFAVTDESIGDLDAMVRLAEEVGADLVPGLAVDPFLVGTVPPEVRPQRIVGLSDPGRAESALFDRRIGLARQLPGPLGSVGRWSVARTFRRQLAGTASFPCRELHDLAYLLPNGDLVRCGLDHRPAGNLRRQRFDDLWFGPGLREFRDRVHACPGCMQASVAALSRLYSGCLDA